MALARCCEAVGDADANFYLEQAAQASPMYCFPSGLDHLDLLAYAIARKSGVASFHSYLGNLLFHHRRHREAMRQRDDLSVELATVLNQLERPSEALDLLLARHFQPWEGGEGLVLAQYTTALLQLARASLAAGQPGQAIAQLFQAQHPPHSLGEAKHLLANDSNLHYWLGEAYAAAGDHVHSRRSFERSASHSSNFQRMSLQAFSGMSYWGGLSLQRLGREREAAELFGSILRYSHDLEALPATTDYFATSLPALLLFEDDLRSRARNRAWMLRAAALQGLGGRSEAWALVRLILEADPYCTFALDLLQHPAGVQSTPVRP